jgi:hypothetical protein
VRSFSAAEAAHANLPALLSYILDRDLHFTLSYYRNNDCSSAPTELQFSDVQMIDGMRAAFAAIELRLPGQRIVDSLIDRGNIRVPHHYTCGVGRNYLVINQRGEVAKCQMDMAQPVTTILPLTMSVLAYRLSMLITKRVAVPVSGATGAAEDVLWSLIVQQAGMICVRQIVLSIRHFTRMWFVWMHCVCSHMKILWYFYWKKVQ